MLTIWVCKGSNSYHFPSKFKINRNFLSSCRQVNSHSTFVLDKWIRNSQNDCSFFTVGAHLQQSKGKYYFNTSLRSRHFIVLHYRPTSSCDFCFFLAGQSNAEECQYVAQPPRDNALSVWPGSKLRGNSPLPTRYSKYHWVHLWVTFWSLFISLCIKINPLLLGRSERFLAFKAAANTQKEEQTLR